MGIQGTVKILLPELARLAASIREAASQMQGANAQSRQVTVTFSGPAYERWRVATAKLLQATAKAITRIAGPEYVQSAVSFVYSCAYYVLTAVIAETWDPKSRPENLPGNLAPVKGLTLPGYGLPTMGQEFAALRSQIASLTESYHRSVTGDWGPPGSRNSKHYETGYGALVGAWDSFVADVTLGPAITGLRSSHVGL